MQRWSCASNAAIVGNSSAERAPLSAKALSGAKAASKRATASAVGISAALRVGRRNSLRSGLSTRRSLRWPTGLCRNCTQPSP
eukprot:2665969-Prymnesium_polylepis.1